MKVVSTAKMRELDKRAMEEGGIEGEELMEQAGLGAARVVERLASRIGLSSPLVHVFAGRGNNGGDGFAVARILREDGMDVNVWVAADRDQIKGDALKHLGRMKTAGIKPGWMPTIEEWRDGDGRGAWEADIAVDSLLGIGVSGPPRGPVAGAIGYVNNLGRHCPVVAVDVPSGLNADTGSAEGEAVRADVTVTMAWPKAGLAAPQAVNYTGNIEVADIGIPSGYIEGIDSEVELITAAELADLTGRRPRDVHKGVYGHALLIGGSRGYAGAMGMAGASAMRSGCGLVSLLVPESIAQTVAAMSPECMVHGGKETAEGVLTGNCVEACPLNPDEFDAVLIGPGMRATEGTARIVEKLLGAEGCPVVADADALNICAGRPEILAGSPRELILTPHPGEMAGLTGKETSEIQADRMKSARSLAEETGKIVVLKGAATIVARHDAPLNVNTTGNPGMASGGTGDVLGGVLAGLAAQGLALFDAARLGVFLHGRAGDNAAWRSSQSGITAGDLISEIPFAIKEIGGM
ncbi:MAG: NAD(P)H-hydrate dehydratase [Kiritimatiellia bacterium]